MLGLAASAIIAIAGCPSSDSAAAPRLGDAFVLAVGDTATIASTNLWLRFARVASDSRCPSGTQCVWAGDAAVVIETAPFFGDARTDTLHTALDPQSVKVGLIELRVVRLDPYPESTGSIPIRAYRLTLITQEVPLD